MPPKKVEQILKDFFSGKYKICPGSLQISFVLKSNILVFVNIFAARVAE